MSNRNWAVLCHLSALAAFVLPFGHLIGPLVVWGAGRERAPEVDRHGRASLNFQLTFSLVALLVVFFVGICALVMVYLGFAFSVAHTETLIKDVSKVFVPIALMVLIVAFLLFYAFYGLVMVIVNVVRASSGREPRYGLAFQFIKN